MQGKDQRKSYSEEECKIDIAFAQSFFLSESYLGISFGEPIDAGECAGEEECRKECMSEIPSREQNMCENEKRYQEYPYQEMECIFLEIVDQKEDQKPIYDQSEDQSAGSEVFEEEIGEQECTGA